MAPRKDQKPTPEQYAAYSSQFEWFNTQLFVGILQPALLNFSRKAGAAGFFSPDRWARDGAPEGRALHEISVNPDTLSLPASETAQTLVHEMVHLWQADHGHPSRSGYHNKEWVTKMREIGLEAVSQDSDNGTGQRVSDRIIPGGRFEEALRTMPPECQIPYRCKPEPVRAPRAPRPPPAPGEKQGRGASSTAAPASAPAEAYAGDPAPATRNKIKYTCPECMVNVWGKPGLRIACEDCRASFEEIGLSD